MENKRIACIDSDSLVWKAVAPKIKYDEQGQPVLDELGNKIKEDNPLELCKDIVDDLINQILTATSATHYILALTVGKNHRYQIYPEYKANRKNKERPKHFDAVKEHLIIKHKAVWNTELEADDICLINSKILTNETDYAFICSLDKDLLQLEGTHYNYDKNMWAEVSKEEAELGMWTELITGQSGDNIKGVPGKGIAFVEKLFKDATSFADKVLATYVDKYGVDSGIEEFYKNYKVLKIKNSWPSFVPSEPIKYNKFSSIDINLTGI